MGDMADDLINQGIDNMIEGTDYEEPCEWEDLERLFQGEKADLGLELGRSGDSFDEEEEDGK